MRRCILIILLAFSVHFVHAQQADSMRVVFYNDKWAIQHQVQPGENVFMLSKKYHVPPALLADLNGINYQAGLEEGTIIHVPFSAFNQVTTEPVNRSDIRPVYYIVRKYDNLFRLAHMAGVQQRQLQEWNNMPDNYIEEGQKLFVGWILYDLTKKPFAESGGQEEVQEERHAKNSNTEYAPAQPGETVIVLKEGVQPDTMSAVEKLYMSQTSNEQMVQEERGTAVFYENKGKLQGTNKFYAFHNTAKVGSIIKVYNPGTDKTVFVKVLGPLPNTKQYHNSVIGISNGAKEALLVTENKTWVELKFAPAL